jgi:hypothetical protein
MATRKDVEKPSGQEQLRSEVSNLLIRADILMDRHVRQGGSKSRGRDTRAVLAAEDPPLYWIPFVHYTSKLSGSITH